MSDSGQVARVTFSRLPSQGIIYGFDTTGFFVTAAAAGVAAVAVVSHGVWGLLLTLPATVPLAVLGTVRMHGQSLITHVGREVMGWARKATGATKFRRRPEAQKVTPESALDLPGREGRLHLYETSDGAVVVWDALKSTATVSCVIATAGMGLPQTDAMSTVSDRDREGMIFEWSRVLGSFTQKPHIVRVAVLEHTRPGTVAAERRYFEEHAQSLDGGVEASYRQALDQADARTVLHRTQLAVTFALTGEAKTLVKGAGGGKAGMLALAELEMSTITEALHAAGFQRMQWMSAREWGGWGRSIIDPSSQQAVDTRVGTIWEGVDPQEALPMMIDESRTVVETDTSWHRTYWIKEWPRYETFPGFLSRLVFAKMQSGRPVRHTFALIGSPVQVGEAMRRLDDEKRTWSSNADLRAKTGRPTSQADIADWEAIQQHEADLVAGQGELRFSAYLTVTALDRGDLDKESASMLNACSATGLEPRIIPWQQAEALMQVAYPSGLGMK